MKCATTIGNRPKALLTLLFAAAVAAGALALVGTKPAEAAFPGSNGKIVFASNRSINASDPSSTDFEIFTMNPDGTGLTQLTTNAAEDSVPTWSRNGTQIAFTSKRDGNYEVYKMAADGSVPNNLTKNSASDQLPAWSPDGTKIAFSSDRDDTTPTDSEFNANVYTMASSDGSSPIRLTTSLARDDKPVFSPDGTKIAFESYRSDVNNPDVYVMKAKPEGGRNRPVNLSKHSEFDGQPDWSPDGKHIAFASNRGVGTDHEVYTVAADGTELSPLTENSGTDWFPAWSPDGTKLVFQGAQSGNPEILTMDPDGTDPVNITNNSATDISPDWQPTTSSS